MINAPGATIASLPGAATGGTRDIAVALLDNQGLLRVHPGAAGRLGIIGAFQNSGTIEMELGGTTADTQYDRLVISGAATLGGTLNVALINAFTPVSTNTFGVVTFGSRSGTFGTANLPAGITTPPSYNPTNVTLVAP